MRFFKGFRPLSDRNEAEAHSENAPAPAEEMSNLNDEDSLEPDTSQLGPLAGLAPFSPVVIALLRLFEKEDVEIAEVAKLVESDPALTSELLLLVNSPIFGLPSMVTNPAHAAKLLGLDMVLALATTVAMRTTLRILPRSGAVRRLWKHSMATSSIASDLAPIYGTPKDFAHTAGILHDLGRLGLIAAYSESYPVMAGKTYQTRADILRAEHSEWGMDHCEAGLRLASAWRLPTALQQIAARHHESMRGRDLLSLIHTSCLLADDCGFDAISYGYRSDLASTVQTYVPEELRPRIMEKLPDMEKKIVSRLETLDL
jgi:putative nucleotidyltransferase with HDIG domain